MGAAGKRIFNMSGSERTNMQRLVTFSGFRGQECKNGGLLTQPSLFCATTSRSATPSITALLLRALPCGRQRNVPAGDAGELQADVYTVFSMDGIRHCDTESVIHPTEPHPAPHQARGLLMRLQLHSSRCVSHKNPPESVSPQVGSLAFPGASGLSVQHRSCCFHLTG